MKIEFSERAKRIKASEIRELLKLTVQPEIISFAGGLPAAELFPLEKIAEVAGDVVLKEGKAALQYSPTEGLKKLREIIIAQRLNPVHINATLDEISITSGSQQALDFTGKMFINEGDTVIVESPTYLGALNAFLAYNPNYVEIPLQQDGMDMDKLEEVLESGVRPKFIYTIPDYQNPSGITMSEEKRKRLIDIANKYDLIIVEDSPYAELCFDGKQLDPIKSLDTEGRVIYMGTYSKTFTPGLRISWVVGNPTIINKFIQVKQGADLQTSSIDQRIAAEFMSRYDLNEHIRMIKDVYSKRRDVMLDTMKKTFHKDITFTESTGGLFTWVTVRKDIDTKVLMQEALKENVAFVPGASFFASSGHNNYMRLNYSCMPEDKIRTGIERLAKVLNKYYE
ncbi:MAG: PLP-dependent aminotransferase family protein [Clostridia bacterium]|nr:PLP-dependent aminotransferase family protein [Clostridia bacterium]